MEDNLILEGLLSIVTELKEKQEQQVKPASREETINRLDVIEQRILEMHNKPRHFRKYGAGDFNPNRQYQERAVRQSETRP